MINKLFNNIVVKQINFKNETLNIALKDDKQQYLNIQITIKPLRKYIYYQLYNVLSKNLRNVEFINKDKKFIVDILKITVILCIKTVKKNNKKGKIDVH